MARASIFLPLPTLTRRLRRPVLARVCPLFLPPNPPHSLSAPEDALLIMARRPTAWVLAAMPVEVPGGACYAELSGGDRRQVDVRWEEFVDILLEAAISGPRLAAGTAAWFGPDRDVLALGLLRAWGFLHEPRRCCDVEGYGEECSRCRTLYPDERRFAYLPPGPFLEMLRFLSRRSRRLPHELMALPFTDFVLSYRVLMHGPLGGAERAGLEEALTDG